jgi:lipopolysaccharide biosynthesis protein
MLEKLLGSQKTISQIKRAFQNNSNLGIIGPQGHVVPYDYFWEPNSENVIKLSRLLNISTENIEFLYVAGSMFWFRPDALANLLNLELHSRDFEHEKGQIDGTLAHAIERLFGSPSGFVFFRS